MTQGSGMEDMKMMMALHYIEIYRKLRQFVFAEFVPRTETELDILTQKIFKLEKLEEVEEYEHVTKDDIKYKLDAYRKQNGL